MYKQALTKVKIKHQTRNSGTNGRHLMDDHHGPQGQTLILAGGSATDVGRQVLADECLVQREDLRLGFIDGDREGLADLPPELRYILDDVPAHDLIEEIERNPANYPGCELTGDIKSLKSTVPHGTDNLSGAPDGNRPVGILQFSCHCWRYFSLVFVFLLGLIQAVLKMKTGPVRLVNQHTQQVLVLVSMVASTCGGTGSALLVLVQDLLRYLARYNLGVSRIEFHAHVLLPGVFLGKAADMQDLLAKTYAFFVELLARYEGSFSSIRYGPIHLARNRAPFAWVYLYDTINQRDRLLTTRQQIAEVIKHVWEYINFGPMADRYRALQEHMRPQLPAIFSAAGIAGVEFPVSRIKKQGAYRTSLAVLETLLTPDSELESKAEQIFQDFLRQHPEFNHLPNLRLDVDGKPLTLSYRQFAANLDQVPRQHLLTALENVIAKLVANIQDRQEQIGQQETARRGHLLSALIQSILSRPNGLQIADLVLIKFDRLFTERQLGLSQQITHGNEELEGQKRAAQTGSRGRLSKLTLNARQKHIQAGYKVLSQMITVQSQSQQYQIITALRDQIGTHRQAIASMTNSLTELSPMYRLSS